METRKKYMNGYRLVVWDEAGLQKSYTFVTNFMTAVAMLVLKRKGYTEITDPI